MLDTSQGALTELTRWRCQVAAQSLCIIDNCRKPVRVKSRGWCQSHYLRWLRHGNPLAGGTPLGSGMALIQTALETETDECVIWPFGTNGQGYGLVTVGGKHHAAHRVVCKLAHGEPPSPELFALHRCGNGHLGCVNPRHLRWGTAKENSADRNLHGTGQRGEKSNSAKLTECQAREILSLKGKMSQRAIAAKFGVGQRTISDIHNRITWVDLI